MSTVIVDSRAGNTASVSFAFERLGAPVIVTADADAIRAADRVVLPGVAAAGFVMGQLQALGLVDVLRGLKQPLLGICLGMQLLFDESEEDGGVPCLGFIPGKVRRIEPGPDRPVPHMGWSRLALRRPDPLIENMADGAYVYFAHSYACDDTDATLAAADYGRPVPAIVRRGNVMGCQFHPERSSKTGEQLLKNFLGLT